MRSLVLLPLLAALASATAVAQIPRTISFQGRAETATAPVTGQRDVTIKIWDAATGGTLLFTDVTQPVQFTDGGVFAMAIGANAPGGIPPELFNRPLWVGITIQGVNGGAEFTPRYALHASPYTFHAGRSDSAGNALLADSAAKIPWQLGEGDRDRTATLDITNGVAGGGKDYTAALHVRGTPYAIVSQGIDSVNGYVVVTQSTKGTVPASGALYRDNVPVAWGTVVPNATGGPPQIAASFGIDSVVVVSGSGIEYLYRVYMQRPIETAVISGQQYPQMSATVTALVGGQDNNVLRVGVWSPIAGSAGFDPKSFYIQVRDSAGRNVSAAFSFQVFGTLP